MRIALIITTASGDPLAAEQLGGGGYTRTPMRQRAEFLREKILPAAKGFDEVIVAGRCADETLDGFDVTHIEIPPLKRDRSEALRIREIATRCSSADIFVYSCDDHMLGDGFAETLREIADEDWDVLTPKRMHEASGKEMNNGKAEGYSPFHTNVLKRWVWARVPFTSVDVIASDVPMSNLWRSVGAEMVWDDRLYCVDVEATENEL